MKIFPLHSIPKITPLLLVLILAYMAYFVNPNYFRALLAEAGTSKNVSGYAWGENLGWVSFNSTNDGSPVSYGVNIDPTNRATGGTGNFSGYAWSENIGWISFNRVDTGTPPAPPFNGATGPIAQVDWSTGKVTGWARAISGTWGVGWDGWIKLSDDSIPLWNGSGVKISGNNFSGFAWGGADGIGIAGVVGWIDFSPTVNTLAVPVHLVQVALPCTAPNVTTWSSCKSSALCTTPPSNLTGQSGFRTGICPTPTYAGTVIEACSSATVTCTAPLTPTLCGNGICETGETFLNCSKDCRSKVREF